MPSIVVPSLTWSELAHGMSSIGMLAAFVILAMAGAVILLARTAIGVGTEFEGEVGNRAFALRIRVGAGSTADSGADQPGVPRTATEEMSGPQVESPP